MMKNLKRIMLFSLLLFGAAIWAQEKIVTGVVTDADELPVSDVTVTNASTGEVVYTDDDGQFSIKASQGDLLSVAGEGLTTKSMNVGSSSTLNFSTQSDIVELEGTVLTALGLERKKDDDLSSSTVVQTDVVERSGEAGLLQALSGKGAGINITQNNGDPGAGAFIQLRGQNSISGSASPLIVIDGVIVSNNSNDGDPSTSSTEGVGQQSRLNDINQEDIEDITVIKGAAAAAIYGTDAGNGVIVIKTKSGSGTKGWGVNYSGRFGVDEIIQTWEKQNIYGQGYGGQYLGFPDFATTRRSFFAGTSWGDKIEDRTGGPDNFVTNGEFFTAQNGNVYFPFLRNADGSITKNSRETFNDSNFDEVFQFGVTQNHNLSISRGTEKSSTFLGLGYLDQQGIVKNSDYTRINARFNYTTELNDRLTFRLNSNYIHSESNRVQQGSNLNGLYLGFLRTPADFDNRDYIGTYTAADGSIIQNAHRGFRDFLGSAPPAYNNPSWTVNRQLNPNEVNRVLLAPELNFKISDNINATARYGLDYSVDTRYTFFPFNSGGNFSDGLYRRDILNEKQETFNAFVSGNHDINSVKVGWVAGYLLNVNNFERLSGQSRTFTNPFATFPEFRDFGNSSAENNIAEDFVSQSKKHAFYGTFNAEFFDQLLVEITGRMENPSTLPNQSIFFPSFSTGWKFTENMNSKILSFGKIRASYGEVAVEPSVYLASGSGFNSALVTSSWGDELEGSLYGNPFERGPVSPNPNLQEERIKEFEVGADLRFFNNRFGMNFTYYDRKTEDVILEQSLAASTGFTSIFRNAGEITNKGIELDFNGKLIKKKNFSWNMFGTFTRNRNEAFINTPGDIFLAGFTGTSSAAIDGEPVGILYGGRWLRDGAGEIVLDANGFPEEDTEAGVIGDPNPDWRGSVGTEFGFKGLRLTALVETSQGNDVWNGTRGVMNFFGVTPETATEVTISAADAQNIVNFNGTSVNNLGHATQNPDGSYTVRGSLRDYGAGTVLLDQEWYTQRGGGFGNVDEQFVEDGSWVKLREVSLFYNFPRKVVSKIGIQKLEFGITGRNLALWTDVEGFDPESNLTGATRGRGLEYFTNPGTRSFIFNLKIGF